MDQQVTYDESVGTDSSVQIEPATAATWRDYLELTKPGITVSNLMTAFVGLWLASKGSPDLGVLIFTMLGTALFIMSGAALNNYYDRDLDQKMKRTKNRGVASGKISPRNALLLGIALLLLGLVVLGVLVHPLAAVWGLIGHIFYVLIYTPLKRVTTLNTVVGGISGAAPPVIGWVAVTHSMDMGAWMLFLVLFLWQSPHFLALAMMKVEDYREGGLPMLPVVKGFYETKRQMFFWGAALFPASLLLYAYSEAGLLYLIVTSVLGLIYLVLLLQGFKTQDDLAWAKKLFGYSLVYLMAFCGAIFISVLL
ncbi:heme o synthase [Brevibacillus migulae]|uniref:heme o synthase n=1 Tax=Brevibacillus migulae TaxID=1644114 RepID=UPI00106EF8E5|nr:heme o synthase [Brevibacillus migulae]